MNDKVICTYGHVETLMWHNHYVIRLSYNVTFAINEGGKEK